MTWAEFKAAVEAKGLQDTDQIASIFVEPDDNSEIFVKRLAHNPTYVDIDCDDKGWAASEYV